MKQLINNKLYEAIQNDLPLVHRPFKEIGLRINLDEYEVLSQIKDGLKNNFIRELSALFNPGKLGFKSTLIAASVPPDKINIISENINNNPGVSHNYLREYKYNIWFTLTIAQEKDFEHEIKNTIQDTSIKYLLLPSLKIFKLRVHFNLGKNKTNLMDIPDQIQEMIPISQLGKKIINILQHTIPLTPTPFLDIAKELGVEEDSIIKEIQVLKKKGIIKRISAVLRHRNIGFSANGMACFNIESKNTSVAGDIISEFAEVSHCYERPVYPDWPYSTFAMVHAKNQDECKKIVKKIAADIVCSDYIILFSIKEFKKEKVKFYLE